MFSSRLALPEAMLQTPIAFFFAAREWILFLGLFPNINVEKLYLAFVAGYFLHTLTAVFLPSRFVEKVTPSFTSSRYLSEPLPLF